VSQLLNGAISMLAQFDAQSGGASRRTEQVLRIVRQAGAGPRIDNVPTGRCETRREYIPVGSVPADSGAASMLLTVSPEPISPLL